MVCNISLVQTSHRLGHPSCSDLKIVSAAVVSQPVNGLNQWPAAYYMVFTSHYVSSCKQSFLQFRTRCSLPPGNATTEDYCNNGSQLIPLYKTLQVYLVTYYPTCWHSSKCLWNWGETDRLWVTIVIINVLYWPSLTTRSIHPFSLWLVPSFSSSFSSIF